MGILFLPATLIAALVLAGLGVDAPGSAGGNDFDGLAMRWILTLPLGYMMVVSGFMHTVKAKSTAANIGWETSPFQYELGFASLGIGIAGIVAAYLGTDAWIPIVITTTSFLVLAGVNHVIEMVRQHNLAPGNSLVLLYDFGVPITAWPLLFATGAI